MSTIIIITRKPPHPPHAPLVPNELNDTYNFAETREGYVSARNKIDKIIESYDAAQ